jgi:hypothetical protein
MSQEQAPNETLLDLLGEREYTILGIGSGLIALNAVPLVFGPLSIFCGLQIYRHHHTRNGIAVAILGLVCLIEGIVFS